VRLNKGDFIGREALLRAKERGITRKLCCLTLDEPGAVVLGKEPIVSADSEEALGYVTSADYGYSVGQYIAYGYLPATHADKGRKVDVVYFGQRLRATVADDPLFDPAMERLRK
jgi:glycine cleavage system aminomethyltransferase T